MKKNVNRNKKKNVIRQENNILENIMPRVSSNSTISITMGIILVIFLVVGIVLSITYIYIQDNTRKIQNAIIADIILNIKIPYNKIGNRVIYKTIEDDLKNISVSSSSIKDDLNKVLSDDFSEVRYVVIVNKEAKPVSYDGRQVDNNDIRIVNNVPKLLKDPNYSNVQEIFIEKNIDSNPYYIFIGMSENNSLNKLIKDSRTFILWFFLIMLLLSIPLAWKFAKTIGKPIKEMELTVAKIAKGDLSGRLDYTIYTEINNLVQAYNTMASTMQRLYSTLENQVSERTKELKSAYAELQNTQAMMVHSEKMKSLGELVAGIMHEINNPINFIYGNMTHLSNYSNDLIEIIETYTKFDNNLQEANQKEINELKSTIDYEFLKTDLPDLIKSCKEGADRAKNIIQDLKSFSRMEEVAITDVDIPHEIDMTLNILHNKLKHKAEIHKEYMENVPKIEAFGGQLNQVFMNILDNAAGAIKDRGDIWIRLNTDKKKEKLIIEIEDNGMGMDEEVARKVFDPFFTTKPVGQGTGLGMSITHKIIKNHQGDIRVESKVGVGTKFIITLPVNINRENLNANLVSGEANG